MIQMKKYLGLAFLFFAVQQMLMAQEEIQALQLSVDLEQAVDIALENNLKLKDQLLDIEIAETQVDQVKARGLPQINANLDYQYTILNAFAERTSTDEEVVLPTLPPSDNFTSGEQSEIQGIAFGSIATFFGNIGDAFASTHAANAGVGLNQMLFDGAFLLGLKASKVYVDLARTSSKPTIRDISKNVERSYYGVLVAQEGIDIIDKNIANLSTLLHDTEQTYEAGFVEQLDVDRLNLSLSTLKNTRKNYVALLNLNYDVFKNALNIPLSSEVQLTDSLTAFAQTALSDEIVAQVADPQLWPEFELFDIQEDITDLSIERIKKERLPKVNAFLNGNYNYQGNEFIFNKGWYPNLITGLSVSFPIFDGNLKKNQIKENQLQLQKIQLDRDQLQVNINLQIRNAFTQFLNAKTDVQNQLENIDLANKIYNTTKIKYREGVGSSVEMIQAEQELYNAQQNYISALYDLLIAKVDLEQALGK